MLQLIKGNLGCIVEFSFLNSKITQIITTKNMDKNVLLKDKHAAARSHPQMYSVTPAYLRSLSGKF
jgi:hypothetical protein